MKKYFVLLIFVGMISVPSAFAEDHSHTTFHSHDGYISHSHGYRHNHNINEEHGEIDWHSEANGVDAVHEQSQKVESEPFRDPHTHTRTHAHDESPSHTHTVNHHNHASGVNHPFELFHVYPIANAVHQGGIVESTPDPPPKPKPVPPPPPPSTPPPPPTPIQHVPAPQTGGGGGTPPSVTTPPSSPGIVTYPPPVVVVPARQMVETPPIETPKIEPEPIPIEPPPRIRLPRVKRIPIARKWHIDVTEVMLETFSKGQEGLPVWVEVWNKGDKAYSLKGWRVVVEFDDGRKDRIFNINQTFVVPKGKARLLVNHVDAEMQAWLHDKQSEGAEAAGGKNGEAYNSEEDHRVIDEIRDINVETFTGNEKHPINAMTFILRDHRHRHPTGGLLRNNVWKLQSPPRPRFSSNRRDVFTFYPKHHPESTEQRAVDKFGYMPRDGDYSQPRKSIPIAESVEHPLYDDDSSLYAYGHDADIGSPTFYQRPEDIPDIDSAPAAPSLIRPKKTLMWATLKSKRTIH